MKLTSLYSLALAVLATMLMPSAHASQAQAPASSLAGQIHLNVALGAESNAERITFVSDTGVRILAMLLGKDQEESLKQAAGSETLTVEAQGKHEAIRILHAIESNRLEQKVFEEARNTGTGSGMVPETIFANPNWQPMKDALNALQGSFQSYESLYAVLVILAKNNTFNHDELEQFLIPCYNYRLISKQQPAETRPNLPATKSFFSARPWAKYATYLVAGAAIVCSGYCLYKYADMGKIFTARQLAKLVGIKA